MLDAVYKKMADVERRHWWFRARRDIILDTMKRHIGTRAKILDVGCGTGFMVEGLERCGEAWGTDDSSLAREACHLAGLKRVRPAEEFFDSPTAKFDALCFLDVLEHVPIERPFLEKWMSLIKPEAKIVVTVPAFQFLWGRHDEVSKHFRRYTRARLNRIFEELGFEEQVGTYFNTLLFPLVLATRLLDRIRTPQDEIGNLELPAAWLNSLLFWVFSMERPFVRRFFLPFGVSYMGIYTRKMPGP